MDHLWRLAKGVVSANRQYDDIDQQAAAAEDWFLWLTPREAKRKAGMLSKNFGYLLSTRGGLPNRPTGEVNRDS
jgi:hypothetical protein